MLRSNGFVSTCNSTHFFMVRDGVVWTSKGEYCLDGITRRKVLEICDSHGIPYTLEISHLRTYIWQTRLS